MCLPRLLQMKYMGSKSRIASKIVPIIQSYIDEGNAEIYIEPFVGGANVIDKIRCKKRIGYDIHPQLIALLNHVKQGHPLPASVSKEEYAKVRANPTEYPDAYVGCVGFLSSYNGRYFDGGYSGIRQTKGGIRDYYDEAKRNLQNQAKGFENIEFYNSDFRDIHIPKGAVLYCDPPYHGTKQFSYGFDHNAFWSTIRKWSQTNTVIISEQVAPDDFKCLWAQEIIRTQDNAKRTRAVEKLFTWNENAPSSTEDSIRP